MDSLIMKFPRCDIGGPTGHTSIVTLAEATEDCMKFSDVKSRDTIKASLLKGEPIYTNFYTYRRLVD